jgi:hypothetical protein
MQRGVFFITPLRSRARGTQPSRGHSSLCRACWSAHLDEPREPGAAPAAVYSARRGALAVAEAQTRACNENLLQNDPG